MVRHINGELHEELLSTGHTLRHVPDAHEPLKQSLGLLQLLPALPVPQSRQSVTSFFPLTLNT